MRLPGGCRHHLLPPLPPPPPPPLPRPCSPPTPVGEDPLAWVQLRGEDQPPGAWKPPTQLAPRCRGPPTQLGRPPNWVGRRRSWVGSAPLCRGGEVLPARGPHSSTHTAPCLQTGGGVLKRRGRAASPTARVRRVPPPHPPAHSHVNAIGTEWRDTLASPPTGGAGWPSPTAVVDPPTRRASRCVRPAGGCASGWAPACVACARRGSRPPVWPGCSFRQSATQPACPARRLPVNFALKAGWVRR